MHTDLLSGEFRHTLALAIENCVLSPQAPPRFIGRLDMADEGPVNAIDHPAILGRFANFEAVEGSGGD